MNIQDIKTHPNKIYKKLFLSFLILSAVTIVLSSSLLYINYLNSATSLINNSIQENLSKISYSASLMKDNAKVLASQMYKDREIRRILFGTPRELTDLIIPIERLESYTNSASFVHSIYIYNGRRNVIYTDRGSSWEHTREDFFDQGFVSILKNPDSSIHMVPQPREIKENRTGNEKVFTFLFFQNLQIPVINNYIIAINYSEQWLNDLIASMDDQAPEKTRIINDQGEIVAGGSKSEILENISDRSYIRRVLQSEKSAGYFIDTYEGERVLVNYVSAHSFNWKYLYILPFAEITESTAPIRAITILAALIVLSLGFILSYVISKRLYRPINRILIELKKIEDSRGDDLFALKQMF